MRLRLASTKRIPNWLQKFSHAAASSILDHEWHAPIGCHFHHNKLIPEWEVTLFLSATEVIGGALDGTQVPIPMQVNIGRVLELFDAAPEVHWQTHAIADDDQLAQHIAFQGTVGGQNIWLRILQHAPQGVEPGRLVDSSTGTTQDLW